ncbi:hypothetical protein AbraIFM66951_010656 [Aspergillus brasiliensis]|uniref:Uncharacterized protein n=1 Tax=Aspergillus brasiliensis TaxID=319629 RepID=A0A9W6DH13_9EURO|nr:hypothetical protein AbraCBS73388_005925 [Aspergillus brasiliensis]GKZ47300.1 hypothetical protein AbraIFM66951_010656 [Aspergillus brasiliensis]
MSTNRPFLANFLAAFRAQSTYKASTAGSQSATAGPSSSLSSTQISQGARAIATKASSGNAAAASSDASPSTTTHHYHHHSTTSASSSSHSRPHSHQRSPLNPSESSPASPVPPQPQQQVASSPPTPAASNPIPITNNQGRQRRGSDSSSGSGGFRDALGPEKWYIGGRTPGGEERFYRLGMVTKGGGRLGGSGRVGSIDQLSL